MFKTELHLTFFNRANIAFSLTNCKSKKVVLIYWDLNLCFYYISQVFFGGKQVIFDDPFKESPKVFSANTNDCSFPPKCKKNKIKSNTQGAFALNKTLDFSVSAEERDKTALKNYWKTFVSDSNAFNKISPS